MPPLALTAMSFKYHLYSKLLSSADNKSQQAFLGCKCSHSVCQLTLSHTAFSTTSQEALLRQHVRRGNSVAWEPEEARWEASRAAATTVAERPRVRQGPRRPPGSEINGRVFRAYYQSGHRQDAVLSSRESSIYLSRSEHAKQDTVWYFQVHCRLS